MDLIEALDVAEKRLLEVASTIAEDQWTADTPCEGWTVHDLIDHVASGSAASAVAARGSNREEVESVRSADHLGEDPFEGLSRCLHDQLRAFEVASRDQAVEYFPFPADVAFHLQFRLADVLIHTWDLARAVGAEETLDPDVVEIVWNHYSSIGRDALRGSGRFGTQPTGKVNDDLDRQQQLLLLAGRTA